MSSDSLFPEHAGDDGMPAGWQLHPSTLTGHYFPARSRQSLCKRESRTTGPVAPGPGALPCSICKRRHEKLP